MTAQQLRQKYLDFFKSKGHTIIPSASLVPHETDASTLFTTAGMHPLVPYLLGAEHPGGKRVVNVQKCVRTGDIEDVGDNRHLTFFEMMGNWSFGDYFKEEAIKWSFEFLTSPEWLGLDPKRLYVTTFKGENGIPRDEKAIEVWKETFAQAGMDVSVAGEDEMINNNVRIIPLGTDDNFWIAGATGPCGGDTEMFYDTRPEEGKLEGKFSDLVGNYRLIEIWNDVFMEFNKTADGQYIKLEKPNVDTGMGVERTLMVLSGENTVFETELFQPIFQKLETLSKSKYMDNEETKKAFRIIADHIKTATLMISDGVIPSNTAQGYVLRRIIRRAIRYGKVIGLETDFSQKIAQVVIDMYGHFYQELPTNKNVIFEELKKEEDKFIKTLEQGLKKFNEIIKNRDNILEEYIDGKFFTRYLKGELVFDLYQSYGFPFEITKELAAEHNTDVDEAGFNKELEKHQELSRTASAGMFKGGLADTEGITIKYHTATHLLLAALREILGPETFQKGSNITAERLRFDFNYDQKLTPEQIKQVEDLINQKIGEKIPVELSELPKEEALKIAKVSFDPSKYGDIVKVYKIGDFSIELCGGPHVNNTEELGRFKIQKEEASSAGVRRIKAVLE